MKRGMKSPLALALALTLGVGGCGGKLVTLANQGRWQELDREARAMKRPPQGKSARAWARARVELGDVEEARAILLRDFRTGGREASLLELAALEASLGLDGMAIAHFARLYAIDDRELRDSDQAANACEGFRRRAQALARLGEPLAADADLRRLAGTCPDEVSDADRELLAAIEPDAEQQARAQRSMIGDEPPAARAESVANSESSSAAELRLAEQLMQARKRSPRAVLALADAEQMQLEPEDVALLLGAEFVGALGPGLISSRRLSGWVGDSEVAQVVDAISSLPDGVREYAFLRLASVRRSSRLGDDREAWIVAAMDSLDGRGPRETAKAWRVAASSGDLASAEFILNTNLRGLAVKPSDADPSPIGLAPPWWLTVPVDRQTFDLLLSLARLFELRAEKQHEVLALRRRVIAAGYEAGLAQVGEVAIEEVRRQLVLGHPWQALAIADVIPGPLVDELLPTLASALGLRAALRGEGEGDVDRQVVARTLGDEWVATWQTRVDALAQVPALGERPRCPSLASWLDPEAAESLRAVGLDPEASRHALELALADLDGPQVGPALVRALEADAALACSGPLVIPLLAAGGLHELAFIDLDERLIHAPELEASLQHQLHAELALGHGQLDRASLLTNSAAAISESPRELWARAAVAGRDFGAREYMLEALRQVLLHSPGLHDEAARRELLLTRLRDVDRDAILRDSETEPESAARQTTFDALERAIHDWLVEAPIQRRWGLLEGLIVQLAGESRADALAWSLLAELLLDPDTRDRHPAAAEAFDRAVERASHAESEAVVEAGGAGKLASARELAFFSDSAALCELAPVDADAKIGAATACDPRSRAQALADLVASATPEQRVEVRARVLAGVRAVEVDLARPGTLLTVPALVREGLVLRVVFGLPLDPAWIVDSVGARSERG